MTDYEKEYRAIMREAYEGIAQHTQRSIELLKDDGMDSTTLRERLAEESIGATAHYERLAAAATEAMGREQ